jgi:integrase/recombinase XerD
LHGLKKASMTRLAHAGTELMAISGHKTLSQVERYTEWADRKRLANAGMAKRLRGAQQALTT